MKWYIDVLKKYAVFHGRARRKEYWMFFLVNIIVAVVLGAIEGVLGIAGYTNQRVLATIYPLAMLTPTISVGVRRMHDTAHSGWWLLFPIVNLFLAVREGQRGDNRFGPDPRATSPTADDEVLSNDAILAMVAARGGRGFTLFLLSVFPIALLFLTVPHSIAMVQVIRGFQQIANEGSGGLKVVAPLCLAVPHALRWGAIGLLISVGTAATLQVRAIRADRETPASESLCNANSSLRTWILAASSMLIIPVGIDTYFSEGIPRFIMEVGLRADRVKDIASSEMAQISSTIATQTLLAVLAGATLSVILVVCGVFNLVTVRFRRPSARLLKYSWTILAAAGILACWNIIRTTADIRSFEFMLR